MASKIITLPEDATPVGIDGLYVTPSGDFLTTVSAWKGDKPRHLPNGKAKRIPRVVEDGKSFIDYGGDRIEADSLIPTPPESPEDRVAREEAERREAERREAEARQRAEEDERRRAEQREIEQIAAEYWKQVEQRPEVVEISNKLRERREALIREYRDNGEAFGWEWARRIEEDESKLAKDEKSLMKEMELSYFGKNKYICDNMKRVAERRFGHERLKAERREIVAKSGPGNPVDLFLRPGYVDDALDWPWLTPGEEAALKRGEEILPDGGE